MRNTFLVCYDIGDDKRLKKVFKTMRDFADHLQYDAESLNQIRLTEGFKNAVLQLGFVEAV